VREWLKRVVLKTTVRETLPGVRIPPSPPSLLLSDNCKPGGMAQTKGNRSHTFKADLEGKQQLQEFNSTASCPAYFPLSFDITPS
jgi:hypothetical protein